MVETAWVRTQTNRYLVATQVKKTVSGANLHTDAIGDDIGNKKTMMGVLCNSALGVPVGLYYEISHDGTNFGNSTTIDASIDRALGDVNTYMVDLTGIRAPYFRLTLIPSDTTYNSNLFVTFFYCNR